MNANFRKRRHAATVNKNDLKISRKEEDRKLRAASGTLRERFPQVSSLTTDFRMESVSGTILNESKRSIGLDEPLIFNVPCQGGCSGGVFLLTDAVLAAITANQDRRDGMGICQMNDYRDPSLPCGTKFYYQLLIGYQDT